MPSADKELGEDVLGNLRPPKMGTSLQLMNFREQFFKNQDGVLYGKHRLD